MGFFIGFLAGFIYIILEINSATVAYNFLYSNLGYYNDILINSMGNARILIIINSIIFGLAFLFLILGIFLNKKIICSECGNEIK